LWVAFVFDLICFIALSAESFHFSSTSMAGND
jgi:hypothetical protein